MAALPVRRISRTKTRGRGRCSAFSAGGGGGGGKTHCGGGLGSCSSSNCGRLSPDRPVGSTRKLCCAPTGMCVKTVRTSPTPRATPLRIQVGLALFPICPLLDRGDCSIPCLAHPTSPQTNPFTHIRLPISGYRITPPSGSLPVDL